MVRIGVISASSTEHAARVASDLGLRRVWREDLAPTPYPADVGLVWFLGFIEAISRGLILRRPNAYSIVGNAADRAHMRQAMSQLLLRGVDLIIWWTMLPLLLDGPPDGDNAFDDLVEQAANQGATLVFPGKAAFGVGRPGPISVSGIVATRPYLDICPRPVQWADVPAGPADIATWGDWDAIASSWRNVGLEIAGPKRPPLLGGHTFAVWSIASAIAVSLGVDARKPTPSEVRSMLRSLCAPIRVRPETCSPVLGFFEPAQFDILLTRSARATAVGAA